MSHPAKSAVHSLPLVSIVSSPAPPVTDDINIKGENASLMANKFAQDDGVADDMEDDRSSSSGSSILRTNTDSTMGSEIASMSAEERQAAVEQVRRVMQTQVRCDWELGISLDNLDQISPGVGTYFGSGSEGDEDTDGDGGSKARFRRRKERRRSDGDRESSSGVWRKRGDDSDWFKEADLEIDARIPQRGYKPSADFSAIPRHARAAPYVMPLRAYSNASQATTTTSCETGEATVTTSGLGSGSRVAQGMRPGAAGEGYRPKTPRGERMHQDLRMSPISPLRQLGSEMPSGISVTQTIHTTSEPSYVPTSLPPGATSPTNPYRFESANSIGRPMRPASMSRIRARKMQAFQEELTWNKGLQLWVLRRDAWSGIGEDGYIRVAESKFKDNKLSTQITSDKYRMIYDKLVVKGMTPNVPINLGDITKALVYGWQDAGEWPPPNIPPEPSFAKRRTHANGKVTTAGAREPKALTLRTAKGLLRELKSGHGCLPDSGSASGGGGNARANSHL